MFARPLLSASASVGLAIVLVGCTGGRGVTVPAGGDDLDACPVSTIAIEDLAAVGEPGCDLVGSTIALDGGLTLTVGSVGSTATVSSDGDETSAVLANWGVPGVGVYTTRDGRLDRVWSTSPAAQQLQHEQADVDGVTAGATKG